MRLPSLTLVLPLTLLAAACSSPEIDPEGSGDGMLSWDRQAPAGATVYQAPAWTVGDSFHFVSGDWMDIQLRVIEITDERITLQEEEVGLLQYMTPSLGDLGQELPGEPSVTRVNAPADPILHFPLWVGKRWTADVDKKAPGEDAMPLRVEYHCDAAEIIETPLGQLDCLRVWRTARVDRDGEFRTRTTVYWYSPEIGWMVRRLDDGVLLELREAHRQ